MPGSLSGLSDGATQPLYIYISCNDIFAIEILFRVSFIHCQVPFIGARDNIKNRAAGISIQLSSEL